MGKPDLLTMIELRERLIRLAWENPSIRSKLLPVLAGSVVYGTPSKLRDGSWGARVMGKGQPGDVVEVTTRNGKKFRKVVDKVLWSGKDKYTEELITLVSLYDLGSQPETRQTRSKSNRPATRKQKEFIRRIVERGDWFDLFDGSYYGYHGPTDRDIDSMSLDEASSIIEEAKRY